MLMKRLNRTKSCGLQWMIDFTQHKVAQRLKIHCHRMTKLRESGAFRDSSMPKTLVYNFLATLHLDFDLFQLTYSFIDLKSNAA